MTTNEPLILGPLTGAAWTRTPPAWAVLDADVVAWTSSAQSDFWRETGGVPGAHDGNALLAPVASATSDFDLVVTLAGIPNGAYDQFGLFIAEHDRHWIKAGIEFDETLWLSTVATDGVSDWARERFVSPSVRLRATRTDGALRIFVDEQGEWRMIRELTFTGEASAGLYSCSPKGDGFPTVACVERGARP